MSQAAAATPKESFRPRSDAAFFLGLGSLCGIYLLMVVAMLLADAFYAVAGEDVQSGLLTPTVSREIVTQHPAVARLLEDAILPQAVHQIQQSSPAAGWLLGNAVVTALADPNIRYSIMLSLVSCTLTTILCLWVSVPIGYVMSRYDFPGKNWVDALLDIPIVLPPLVVGLCLLMLFKFPPFSWSADWVVFEIPSVILAQFMVACAFAVRTMRATFDEIPQRQEHVALTLGCSQGQAFWQVVLPQARRGMVAAGTLAWARSLGEFGPILIFSSATRMRTEVLSSTVYLEMQAGRLKAALGVSLIMIGFAMIVLVLARSFGLRGSFR